LSGPALLLSDLHLAPGRRPAASAFAAFADGPAREAASIYILGDLFDAWIGDDQLRMPFYRDVARRLRALAERGIGLHVARGNRDFLIGRRFTDACGATLLDERTIVTLGGVATLLTHGDELCTDDVAYQRFRATTRSQAWQRNLLRKPYLVRRGIAAILRLGSRRATARKPEAIMDVNAAAVADAFRVHGVTRIIHGHTHRPARHSHVVDGRPRERHVLAAWHGAGGYLAVDDNGVHEHVVQGDAA
jgi:UDP-2,3-diacylglucosamine hydrolase